MPEISWSEIDTLRHAMANDRMALHKIELHLRDWHRTDGDVQDTVVRSVIQEILDFNCDRLGRTLDKLDAIIDNIDRRKEVMQYNSERRRVDEN